MYRVPPVPSHHSYSIPYGNRLPLLPSTSPPPPCQYSYWAPLVPDHHAYPLPNTKYSVLPCTGYCCSVHPRHHQVITYVVVGLWYFVRIFFFTVMVTLFNRVLVLCPLWVERRRFVLLLHASTGTPPLHTYGCQQLIFVFTWNLFFWTMYILKSVPSYICKEIGIESCIFVFLRLWNVWKTSLHHLLPLWHRMQYLTFLWKSLYKGKEKEKNRKILDSWF